MQEDGTERMILGVAGVGDNVLLTGATGLLGGQIARRILQGYPGTHLTLLVRSTPRETARERVDRLLVRTLGETQANRVRDRVEVVDGNIADPNLGMDASCASDLAARIDQVIHCAATIRFDLPLELARRDNVEGTRNVLDFAARMPRLGRLDYVGTAYIAGKRSGLVKEDELDVGQQFWNSYERTKMEAEKLVRAFAEHHPVAIYRPSIIVGDSVTGQTTGFQGLYQVLPLYSRRLIFAIPADPETHVDLVPIDYVLETMFALMGTISSIGRTFHIVSGPGSTCTIDELVRMVADYTKIPPPPYVSLGAYQRYVKPLFRAFLWGRRRSAMERGEQFLPYLSSKFAFDKKNTDACLDGLGIRVPHTAAYFQKLLAFQGRTPGKGLAGSSVAPRASTAPARRVSTP